MNKKQLIESLVSRCDITKKCADDVLEAFAAIITSELRNGSEVTLNNIGIFSSHITKPRIGRNPKTGEAVQVLSKAKPMFKASKLLKAELNK